MNAVNALQLFILVWTFTAVCQADKHVIVSCDGVTGSVRKEVNLTCSVSLQRTECCIVKYRFHYPDIYNNSAICHQYVPYDFCEQRNSFTCSYTPTTAMTETFTFFVLSTCGIKITKFTVDITESLKHKTDTEAPYKKGIGTEAIVITAVSCFIIIIIIIIVTAIICVKKFKSTNPSGLQKKYERGVSEEQTVMTTFI